METIFFVCKDNNVVLISTYYQIMHISEIEFLLNDAKADCQIDVFIDFKVEYRIEENEI